MTTPNANFTPAADVLATWRDDVLKGTPPTLYPVGAGELAQIEVGPGLVNLIGGAPGSGKTALTMQFVVDALRLTPTLRALVCNVEMSPAVLLDRQLARLSGIALSTIRHRRLTAEHGERIAQAISALEALADRLCFVRPPFDLANVAASADAFGATLLCLDYIQRIRPPGEHADKRGSVDACMDYLRQFADAGVAVIVVSAVGRSKDKSGRNSYSIGLNLASFRESSELEFGADSAFILTPDGPDASEGVTLKHLKDRHGECRDIALCFDGARQAFTPADRADAPDAGKLGSALVALWNRTPAAGETAEGGDNE
jgi:replicative DNA helicase